MNMADHRDAARATIGKWNNPRLNVSIDTPGALTPGPESPCIQRIEPVMSLLDSSLVLRPTLKLHRGEKGIMASVRYCGP